MFAHEQQRIASSRSRDSASARAHSPSGVGRRMPSVPGGLLPTMPTLEPTLLTPTPTQMTNEKQQRPAHSERASGHWINLLFPIIQNLGHTLKLRKPLTVHSMHTGTNSFRMFFRMAGIEVNDVVGAEMKEHARRFDIRNALQPNTFTQTLPTCSSNPKPAVRRSTGGRIFSLRASLASRSAE